MTGSYNADHGMSKWSLKFVCQYIVMIATYSYDHNIYRSHQNKELQLGYEEHVSCWNFQNSVLYDA